MNEESLQQGIATLELIKVQIENLQKQIDTLQLSIQEHIRAIETLEGYTKIEKQEMLVPIGAGVFISVRMGEKKGMLSIGNDLFVELPIERIIENLKTRHQSFETMLTKLTEDMKKLQGTYAALSERVEQDYQKYLEERGNVQGP